MWQIINRASSTRSRNARLSLATTGFAALKKNPFHKHHLLVELVKPGKEDNSHV